jgi:hypothetical protein
MLAFNQIKALLGLAQLTEDGVRYDTEPAKIHG